MYYSAQRAEKKIIALTPGGRPVYAMAYGEKNRVRGEANYSSALGAGNPSYFADPATKRPVLLLIGAVHGQETEKISRDGRIRRFWHCAKRRASLLCRSPTRTGAPAWFRKACWA